MRYATQTEVTVEKSRMEIERILQRYGADGFMYGWQPAMAVISFTMAGKMIKFILPLPDKADRQFLRTPAKHKLRSPEEAYKAWEQACRQKWRALALCIKAKLEAVESGITTFEQEFLAHIVLPNGKTFGEHAIPQINEAMLAGKMPTLQIGYEA